VVGYHLGEEGCGGKRPPMFLPAMPAYVDLSLFYFVKGDDGFVLWGEGLVTAERPAGQTMWSTNLGQGLRVLRVANDLEVAAGVLEAPSFAYRYQGTTTLHLGLKRRPPVVELPPDAVGASSYKVVHQFVRQTKSLALGAVSEGQPALPRDELEPILGRAHAVIGLDLRGRDSHRVGDVTLYEAGAEAPVEVEGVRTPGIPQGLRVSIAPHSRQAPLAVNVRFTGSDDAIVDDVLLTWKPGTDPTLFVPVNQRFGRAQVRVWRDGHLIWALDLGGVFEVNFNVQLVGGRMQLDDRLTQLLERAIQAGNAPAAALPATRQVTLTSGTTSVVGSNLREPWRQAYLCGRAEVFAIAPPPPRPEEYFPQGGGGRAAAIMSFIGLIKTGRSFLVDPFFDAVGAADLLPRISGDVDLTVITSLPDDGQHLVEGLHAYLKAAQGYLPFGIKIRRVVRSDSSEQAFHDRYLIVMGREAPPRGFVLSNSFSGLARKYPIVVAEMTTGTTGAVLQDIETLLESKTISSLWPLPGPGPHRHDPFGRGWRWYLSRLVPRAGRENGTWVAVAAANRWLSVDIEGNPQWLSPRKSEIVDRLLPRRRRISRWGCVHRPRQWGRRTSADLGFRVAALGERVSRGLEVEAADVAVRLSLGDAHVLGKWLRSSFASPDSWEPYGHWRTRMSVHQALRDRVPTRDRVAFGLALWSDTHVVMDLTHEFGRAFVYRVLLLLAPDVAVTTGVELGDPTFIAAALDWFYRDAWSPAVTKAALASASAMVNALGAQSLASPSSRGDQSPLPEPPSTSDIEMVLRELDLADATVVVFACLTWASRTVDATARQDLVFAAITRWESLTAERAAEACEVLLSNGQLLTTLVAVLSRVPGPARASAVETTTRAVPATFSRSEDFQQAELAKSVVPLAALFFEKSGTLADATKALDQLFELGVARNHIERVSPFRRQPEWQSAAARLAFGQVLLLHVGALAGAPDDVEVAPPLAVLAEAGRPDLHKVLLKAVEDLRRKP
jgi:hypothetical protein